MARDDDRRRRRWAGRLLIVGIAGLVAATWVVASRQQTPEQAAANAAPPRDQPVLVSVERRVLEKTIVLRCEARRPINIEVGSPEVPPGSIPVVTRVGRSELGEGSLIVEVSGRPIIALRGTIAAYRTLRPGDVGPDVSQLQQALDRLRLGTELNGVFGQRTQRAVVRLYNSVRAAPLYEDPSTRRGVLVPLGEVVYLPAFPAEAHLLVSRGRRVEGPLAQITAGEARLGGRVLGKDGEAVRPGMPVRVTDDVTGQTLEAIVGEVGRPTIDDAGLGRQVTVKPTTPLRREQVGVDLRCTATLARSDATLVVPVTAVLSAPSGDTYVLVWDADGRGREVSVELGLSSGTHVEIRPRNPAQLREGHRVAVGAAPEADVGTS